MRVIPSTFLAVCLSACATTYQQDGFGGGFSETQLDENVWHVTIRSNVFTSELRAQDFALLRSAELTLQNGYTYFALTDLSPSDLSPSKEPGDFTISTTSHTTVYGSGYRTYGNTPIRTYGEGTVSAAKPSITKTVVMFKDKPEGQDMVYNAEFVCRFLGEKKYKVTCGAPR